MVFLFRRTKLKSLKDNGVVSLTEFYYTQVTLRPMTQTETRSLSMASDMGTQLTPSQGLSLSVVLLQPLCTQKIDKVKGPTTP